LARNKHWRGFSAVFAREGPPMLDFAPPYWNFAPAARERRIEDIEHEKIMALVI
jgi:hypothetical protein